MKRPRENILAANRFSLAAFAVSLPSLGVEVLVEAEAFDDHGGWIADAQFVDEKGMGRYQGEPVGLY